METFNTNKEDVILLEVKSVVEELVTTELPSIVGELLGDILRRSFDNSQSGIQLVF